MQLRKISQLLLTKNYIWIIACWSVGITLGVCSGASFVGHFPLCFHSILHSDGALFIPAALIPLSLAWIVLRCEMVRLIYPLLFSKAFLDGFILLAVAETFGSASWIIGICLLFTDKIATFIFIYFSLRCIKESKRYIDRCYIVCMLVIAAVIALDYFCISAMLSQLTL